MITEWNPARRMEVASDFDRIALARDATRRGEPPDPYDGWVLRQLPSDCRTILDVGCGTGRLARMLAQRGDVLAIDVSPQMLAHARRLTPAAATIEYRLADVMTTALPDNGFDAAVAIASLHHVPLAPALRRLARVVRLGGAVVIVDLYRATTAVDWLAFAAAWPVVRGTAWWRGSGAPTAELRAAWDAHGAHDDLPRLREVRDACRRALPGARVRRRWRWRYSVAWINRGDPRPRSTRRRG